MKERQQTNPNQHKRERHDPSSLAPSSSVNMTPKINPLEIPEILRMVGRLVVRTREFASMRVSKTFYANVAPTSWEAVIVDYTNQILYSDLPSEDGRLILPWEGLKLHASRVRSMSIDSDIRTPPRITG